MPRNRLGGSMTFAEWESDYICLARERFEEFSADMNYPSWQEESDWSAKFQEWLKERENGS